MKMGRMHLPRNLCLIIFMCITLASVGLSQTGSASLAASEAIRTKKNGVFKLGNSTLNIPAPDGFTDIFDQITSVRDRLLAAQSANDLFAIHVENGLVPQFENISDPSLNFYTMVAVSRRYGSLDITSPKFNNLKAYLREGADRMLDPNGAAAKDAANAGLSIYSGTQAEMKNTVTTRLGDIDETQNSLTLLNLSTVRRGRGAYSIVGSYSAVYVRKRLVFVYAFENYSSDRDVDALRSFTAKWIASIVAANR